jgi:anti-anti-sigma regulatory factor
MNNWILVTHSPHTITAIPQPQNASKFGGNMTVIQGPAELVRDADSSLLNQLLPSVRSQSLAIDLSATERLDAAGIAALITLYCTAIESGTSFCVLHPSAHVTHLLRLVGLEAILVQGLAPELTTACCDRTAA